MRDVYSRTSRERKSKVKKLIESPGEGGQIHLNVKAIWLIQTINIDRHSISSRHKPNLS